MIACWRRGDRLATAFFVAYVLPSAFLIGGGVVLSRYMMAFYPLICLLILHGVLWCGRELCRWRSVVVQPAHRSRGAMAMLGGILAINLPQFAVVAIPDALAGHAGRYHQSIEGGRYVDLYAAADFLREHFPRDARIMARFDRTRMLHFLSQRKLEPLLATERWKPEHAQAVYDDLHNRGPFDAVLTDAGKLDVRYTRRLAQLLAAAPDLKVVFRGRYTTIYQRVGPLASSRPASAPEVSRAGQTRVGPTGSMPMPPRPAPRPGKAGAVAADRADPLGEGT
jgi:hypothetical protein